MSVCLNRKRSGGPVKKWYMRHLRRFEFPKNEKQIFQTFIMFVQLNIYFMKLDVLGGSVGIPSARIRAEWDVCNIFSI